MKRSLTIACCAVGTLLLVGCSDPADDVAKSKVSGAEEPASVVPADAKAYTFAEGSMIGFVGSKVTGSHEGGFKEFTGSIYVTDGALVPGSMIEIDMNSTWSDNDRLTGHLKSADFFDVENHPLSTFVLTAVDSENGQSKLTGNFGLHGVTNSISFPAQVSVADNEVKLAAEFAINRKDFEITYPGRPDDLIRDNVVIKFDVTAAAAD